MSESEKDKSLQLEEMKYLSMRHLMECDDKTLESLLHEVDRELFQAQLTRDWLDTAIQFKLWNEAKAERIDGGDYDA